MIATLLLAARTGTHVATCETRTDVEARVAMLSQRMQNLASAHVITMEQLATAIQAVNAADVQYTPADAFQRHCMALQAVAASLPPDAP